MFGPLKRHWSGVCHDFQQAHPGMVISKLNFSKLFAEAWLQAVTPANIIAGFRKCGIHPFNHNAIPILEEVHHIDVDAEDELKHDGMDDEPRDNEVEEQQFTYDQTCLFQRRYEERFDVFEDQDYVTWLRLNYPEAVPSDHSSLRAPTTVLDEFSDIFPLDEIQLSVMESSTSTSALTPPTVSSVMEHSTSMSALTPPTVSSITDPPTSTSPSAVTSAMDFSSANGITTPLSSKQGDTQAKMKKVSPVAKYLQMPTISKTKTPPALSKNRAVTGARVLTRTQCLQIIKEKEMKKQLEEGCVHMEGVECACMGVCMWKGSSSHVEGVECACMRRGGCVHMEGSSVHAWGEGGCVHMEGVECGREREAKERERSQEKAKGRRKTKETRRTRK